MIDLIKTTLKVNLLNFFLHNLSFNKNHLKKGILWFASSTNIIYHHSSFYHLSIYHSLP